MNKLNTTNVRKSANPVLAARNFTNTQEIPTMKTAFTPVTREDVAPAIQGEKADAYRASFITHAGMNTSFGDPAALARNDRTGIPATVAPSNVTPNFVNPVSGLVGNMTWDADKQVGEVFFGKAGQKPSRTDVYERELNSVKGTLNVLRSFIVDENMFYSQGILTRFPEVLTGSGYTYRKGAFAYVKGWAVKNLLNVGRKVTWDADFFAPNSAYEVRLNMDGSLWINTYPTSRQGSKTAAESWQLKFMIAAALESGTGIRLSVGPETMAYADAITSVLNAQWQLENNDKLSDSAREKITAAALEIHTKLTSEYWSTVNKKVDYQAVKSTFRKVEAVDLKLERAEEAGLTHVVESISAKLEADVTWLNGEKVHVTKEMLQGLIDAGTPIVKYSSNKALLEEGKSGWNYTDLRNQRNLEQVAKMFNLSKKIYRVSVPSWK